MLSPVRSSQVRSGLSSKHSSTLSLCSQNLAAFWSPCSTSRAPRTQHLLCSLLNHLLAAGPGSLPSLVASWLRSPTKAACSSLCALCSTTSARTELREAAIMAWSGRLGGAADSGLELSLGLPAYFSKTPGSDAGEEPSDSPGFALQAAVGSNGSQARARPAAAPVVGWPPLRSFRRNLASSRPPSQSSPAHQDGGGHKKGGTFVKINMDGVPIGRKVDLGAYSGYAELSAAVCKLFRGLLAAQRGPAAAGQRSCDEEEEEAPVIRGSGEYTLVYEDEEGDRVLVGDVPWEMFVATARRLRVLKSSDLPASSVSPRVLEGMKRDVAGC